MMIFFSYLKRHLKTIILISLFVLVFFLIFFLYQMPTEPVLYASLLCLCIGIALFIIGFLNYRKKHFELINSTEKILLSIDNLSEPDGLIENDYQNLLRLLRDEIENMSAEVKNKERERNDYYTLWIHQIKTPIAAMNLLLQSEEESELNSTLRSELLKIEQYAEMALSYLRLDCESTDYLFQSYNLDAIVRQAIRKYAKLFIIKKLPVDFRESGVSVVTDEKWLLFVVEQLLSNALKYTRDGSVKIYYDYSSLIIKDSGIGIKEEDLPRIFEKGFTGYNGRENKKSTGIGLYLCKKICDNLGHDILIESEYGKGTTVKVVFSEKSNVFE